MTRHLALAVSFGLALAVGLGACATPARPHPATLSDSGERETDARRDERYRTELQEDILTAYERDEPPEVETGMLRPEIGAARIGVGPADFAVGDQLAKATSRWPLATDASTRTQTISKHLDAEHIWLAPDRSAAWVFDEVSWRVAACGRTAVVPLRVTGLYAHDGDRWIPVFEHTSFARPPIPAPDGAVPGVAIPTQKLPAVADELSRVLALALLHRDPAVLAPGALLLGPGMYDEWNGAAIAQAALGASNIVGEGRRVGTVGNSVARATIAYWVGNFDADYPARPGVPGGKVRLRGSFVFERVGAAWKLAQGDLSQPTEDIDLATAVFGTALVSLDPLRISCD